MSARCTGGKSTHSRVVKFCSSVMLRNRWFSNCNPLCLLHCGTQLIVHVCIRRKAFNHSLLLPLVTLRPVMKVCAVLAPRAIQTPSFQYPHCRFTTCRQIRHRSCTTSFGRISVITMKRTNTLKLIHKVGPLTSFLHPGKICKNKRSPFLCGTDLAQSIGRFIDTLNVMQQVVII